MSRLRQFILPSAVCGPPSATESVAWKHVALQFADALTRLRTPVVPGANPRTVRPVKIPAVQSQAQGAIP